MAFAQVIKTYLQTKVYCNATHNNMNKRYIEREREIEKERSIIQTHTSLMFRCSRINFHINLMIQL